MVTQSAVKTAKEYLMSLPPELDVRRAYIFGSYAKGTQREDSDIDIAVV
jgi:predicted nucleotidyltransferase